MKIIPNHNKYLNLRNEFPVFEFNESNQTIRADGIQLDFRFNVGDKLEFRPEIFIPIKVNILEPEQEMLKSLAFSIGMVEMISYWKAFCSPNILVKPFSLNNLQEIWWKKLFRYGLGEFFYLNGIEIPGEDIFQFSYPDTAAFHGIYETYGSKDGFLVPLGGGKDSVVTLALLQNNGINPKVLVMNHRGATIDVVAASGIGSESVIEVRRKIDPLLIDLNQQGFLNGHTPFSALLAFVSTTVSALTGIGSIALSNESSANEPSIPGTIINHQYSKSLEFESDFRYYLEQFLVKGINYFSFLRPLNELQIGALFSRFHKFHGVFKSCNVGSKTDSWCCNCSKCLFTFIILSPFLEERELRKIFGQNLFEKPELIETLMELSGISENKPFECVGTIEEVNAALSFVTERKNGQVLPVLLELYKKNRSGDQAYKELKVLLKEFQGNNFVDSRVEIFLKKALALS